MINVFVNLNGMEFMFIYMVLNFHDCTYWMKNNIL